MNLDDIKIFLPKYLSSASQQELFGNLKSFPDNIDQRIYTDYLKSSPVIYQGDGLNDLLIVDLPNTEIKQRPAMVLSNTCDIDPSNKRPYPSQIVYAPIIKLDKYIDLITTKSNLDKNQIKTHLSTIRKQRYTQIFYLPLLDNVIEESIVFLDRIYNVSNDFVDRDTLSKIRLFSLSDYGNYLFLFKLSLHFMRIQDSVERKSIKI